MMRMTTILHKFPYHPCRKKENKHPAPSSGSNDSSSCEEVVEGPSVGKGGGKKPKKPKENNLVVSSEGSDSQLSEAEDK